MAQRDVKKDIRKHAVKGSQKGCSILVYSKESETTRGVTMDDLQMFSLASSISLAATAKVFNSQCAMEPDKQDYIIYHIIDKRCSWSICVIFLGR